MSTRDCSIRVVAQIAESIEPIARGAKYEDPLRRALEEAGRGTVTGAGSQLDDHAKIQFADVEMSLKDLDGSLQFARLTLAALGAPAGSLLLFLRDGRPKALPVASRTSEYDNPIATAALERRLAPDAEGNAAAKAAPASASDDDAGVKRMAKKLIADFENLMVERYDREPANLATFPRDWIQWYDRVSDELAAAEFRKMGDVTITPLGPGVVIRPNFSRKFLAADGTIRADVYQLRNTKRKTLLRVCVMKTEFDDATFLSTHNASHKWNTPDGILAERLSPDATPLSIASVHQRRLTEYLEAHAERQPLVLRSLEELLASEARERLLTAAFRRRQDLPTIAELQRLGAKPTFAERIYAEMRKLRAAAKSS